MIKLLFVSKISLKKAFYLIIMLSILVRLTIFWILPDSYTSLAPDEGTYADLLSYIESGKDTNFYPGFGPGLYLTSRFLIIQALFISQFGVSPIDSIRVISSIYGLASSVLIAFYLMHILKIEKSEILLNSRFKFSLILIFFIYTFWPSRFLWSLLGLRESSNEFLLICYFVVLNLIIFHLRSYKKIALYILVLCLLLVCIFSIRFQVAIVVNFVTLILLCFYPKKKLKIRIFLIISLILAGSLSNSIILNQPLVKNSSNYVPDLELKAIGNQDNAVSKLEIIKCPVVVSELSRNASISSLLCIAYRAPLSAPNFLFRPLIGLDTYSTSTYFAAFENIFWLIGVMFIVFNFFAMRTIKYIKYLMPLILFTVVYILLAAAYEGNMGTAFRHKNLIFISLISWVSLIIYDKKLKHF